MPDNTLDPCSICGRALNAEELEFYGHTCEMCEGKAYHASEDAEMGRASPTLDPSVSGSEAMRAERLALAEDVEFVGTLSALPPHVQLVVKAYGRARVVIALRRARADQARIVKEAVEAENEACAALCEANLNIFQIANIWLNRTAAAIRARMKPDPAA